uniref:Methionine synthase reductase n=1 Tax=Anopheles farauti TaxID=69004 RepID=A0A182QGT8_9DIPT
MPLWHGDFTMRWSEPSHFELLRDKDSSLPEAHLQAKVTQPFEGTQVLEAYVTNLTTVVDGEDVKPVYDITLGYSQGDTGYRHFPGDTIGILCYNTEEDVEFILERLNLLSKGDLACSVGIVTHTTKKSAKVPLFVPALVSCRRLFKECLDLRVVPKKLLIRALVPCASEERDRRFLEILCSKEGNAAYERTVFQKGKGLISLLKLVPSCRPTVGLLIEHLPRLMPRPYSLANVYREASGPSVRFLFSHCVENPGITTNYLRGLEKGAKVYFYFRQSSAFVYKDTDLKHNIIMIGTGTGVSPYLSFLAQRADALARGETIGHGELIAGFRYRERSYFCKDEIKEYLQTGALDACHEAFSRDADARHKYVQSQIREKKDLIIENLKNDQGLLYVCGDSKVLLPQIMDTVIDILATEPEANDREEISAFIGRLKKDGKYREDVWL